MIRKLLVCLLLADTARRATNYAYQLGHREGFTLGQLDSCGGRS